MLSLTEHNNNYKQKTRNKSSLHNVVICCQKQWPAPGEADVYFVSFSL